MTGIPEESDIHFQLHSYKQSELLHISVGMYSTNRRATGILQTF